MSAPVDVLAVIEVGDTVEFAKGDNAGFRGLVVGEFAGGFEVELDEHFYEAATNELRLISKGVQA